jgi:hypothetical protein
MIDVGGATLGLGRWPSGTVEAGDEALVVVEIQVAVAIQIDRSVDGSDVDRLGHVPAT